MLPIYDIKDDILNAVRENDTVIVTAETGSGKSTQVPKFLYEAGYDVIVTEPRRIAAVSLAHRVQDELTNSKVVAYQTAFDKYVSKDTKILYCTDGLQVAKGISDHENTILVIDEVHEWNLNIETLIAWIGYIRSTGKKIKTVLMSATADVQNILDYFQDGVEVHVDGKLYEVEKHELPSYELITTASHALSDGKNVLVFVSGKAAINRVKTELKFHLDQNDYIFIPLHGELSREEQDLCFKSYDKPKIVCATNIAQTSITIPDIDVVVDSGLEKTIEIVDGIEGLYEMDISKADIVQRAGRAGRVKNGQYFLCSETKISEREDFSKPEILRLNLEKVVLKLASVGIDADNLTFLHMPSRQQLSEAKKLLISIGAITKENTITEIGSKLVMIPVSVVYGRMITEAEKYGKEVLEDIIIIASICESGSLVRYKAEHPNYPWRFVHLSDFTAEKDSDLIGELELYQKIQAHAFKNLTESGINGKAYYRAKELHHKMMQSLQGIVEFKEGVFVKSRHNALIHCIVSGFFHSLYTYNDARGYISVDDTMSVLSPSRNSIVTNPKDFAVGKPRTITFKNRYGWTQSIDILTNITSVEFESIKPFITEDVFTTKYDESNMFYNPEDDRFHCDEIVYFRAIEFKRTPTSLTAEELKAMNPGLYERLMSKHKANLNSTAILGGVSYRIEENYLGNAFLRIWDIDSGMRLPDDAELVTLGGTRFMLKYDNEYYTTVLALKAKLQRDQNETVCELNGKSYKVYKNWSISGNDELYINMDRSELLALDPNIPARTLNGTPCSISIGYDSVKLFKTVKEAYNYALDKEKKKLAEERKREMERMAYELEKSLPKATSKIELLKEGFSLIGQHTIGDKEVFIGLKAVKKSVKYEMFDTQNESEESTKEALKFLIDTYIKKYPESTFFEKKQGQKVQTVAAVRATREFFNFVSEVESSVTIDTIDDAISMIDEMYEECVSGLKR